MAKTLNDNIIKQATALLKDGCAIAVPTDTVYGLVADAKNDNSIKEIFTIKGRPENKPLIVFVSSIKMAKKLADFNSDAIKLAKAFWPGALTIIANKRPVVSNIVTCNQPTVGLRMVNNKIVNKIIKKCKMPLASTSANISGEPSLTTAAQVYASLGHKLKLIVDGGESPIGTPSTIVSIAAEDVKILRQGSITKQQLQKVLGKEILD